MSLLNEQIDVRSTEGGHPVRFAWRGRMFRVRRVIGDWPARPEAPGAPATQVHMLRVSAESDAGEPSIIDITRDTESDSWTMRRQWN
ncbi:MULTISPECIES: DUF6504 family protein [unclassified Nocardiopsis]|uniref:DUF6504 family protein n=1 Tax=unclassified Nocardiopsis TaxID=2649073 RepID=UPI00135B7E61|nr:MULTISPECIES: DUF6504 family protein [unclassified Nocardiopsis]